MSLLQNLHSVAHEVSGLSIFVLCFGRLSTGIAVVVYCGVALGSKSRALHGWLVSLEDSRLEMGLCAHPWDIIWLHLSSWEDLPTVGGVILRDSVL